MAVTPDAFRAALGSFATGVCVVTCPPSHGRDAIGLTVSSFASVSLEPPLVLWCIDKASDRFKCFNGTDVYGVNILAQGQQALSVAFAGDGLLDDVATRQGVLGVPLIDNAMAQLECRVVARHDAGDHVILVGEVAALAVSEGREPLVYHRGKYHQLA